MFHHETKSLEVDCEPLTEGIDRLSRPKQVAVIHVQNKWNVPKESAQPANRCPSSEDLLLDSRPPQLCVDEGAGDAIHDIGYRIVRASFDEDPAPAG